MDKISILLGFVLLASCSTSPSTHPLDSNKGANGFILGDSLFASVFGTDAWEDYRTREHEVLGHSFLLWKPVEDINQRFFFNVSMPRVEAHARDGYVYFVSWINETAHPSAGRRLLDSLITHYGEPLTPEDTAYTHGWQGERVRLRAHVPPDTLDEGLLYIVLDDIRTVSAIDSLVEQIEESRRDSSLGTVGDIDLFISRDDARRRYDLEMSKAGYDFGHIASSHAESFFGLSEGDDLTVYFREDSLWQIVMWFDKEYSQYSKRPVKTFEELVSLIGDKFGKYDVIIRRRYTAEEEMFRHAYWMFNDAIVIVEEGDYSNNISFRPAPYHELDLSWYVEVAPLAF